MGENLYQNWPVYLLLAGFIVFVISAINNSRKVEKEKKQKQGNPSGTK